MPRTVPSKSNIIPVTVKRKLQKRLQSGIYSSTQDVLHSAFEALSREEAALDRDLKAAIALSLEDPRAHLPSEEVFERLHRKQERRLNGNNV